MKVILHDLGPEYEVLIDSKCDRSLAADGKYAPKNTGVGCHFLLQCNKVKSESEVAQLCPTLSDTMDCGPPGSSVHGICQARVLEWGCHGLL